MLGRPRQDGRLAPFVMVYRVRLLEQGYTPKTVGFKLKDLPRLGRWMDAADVAAGALTVTAVESFLAARRTSRPD